MVCMACGWKDIGMGVRKGTVVSFIPTLFGCFWGFHPYMSVHFFFMFFVTCFSCHFEGQEYRAIDHPLRKYVYIATQVIA